MNPSKKAYISFLMSVFLMSGIAALVHIGVFDFKNYLIMPDYIKVIALVTIFFTLFLFIYFLFNLKRSFSTNRKKTGASADVTRHQGGLLAAASRLSPSKAAESDEISGHDIIYEKNGVPYINSDLAKKNNHGKLNNSFVKLVESVTGSLTPPVS